MPRLSVIVPVYKVEKYIHKCVDSILNQTFTDFELILVDDGSPDNCGRICDEYAAKDSRVRVIHKKNGGVSDARNVGVVESKGDYISFVDPDDFIKSKESVLKDELHRLYSSNPRNIFTTEQQENDWVDKEYNSLTDIIFEFNHQYKASTGFDAKNLSDESLKRVARSYIKSPESLKDDYDDLQSNKVLIEEYLKTDYGSKHGVIVKSLSHYMSGSIREMLFYKHLY